MTMRLAFSAWAMRELPVDQQIDIVRRAGYLGICLVSDPRFPAWDVAEVRRLLAEADLALTAIAGHANPLATDPDELTQNLARIRSGLDLAVELAGPNGPPPLVSMGFGSPETYELDKPLLAERFGQLAQHAASTGGVLALEPHVGQAMDEPEKVVWLMNAVGSPHFRLNFDNSHFEVMGRDMDEYVPMLTPFAVHTDLKDQRGRSPDHEFLVPGEGDFDYARYLRALQGAGYDGDVTVEISVMVQRRADYDPAEVAGRSYRTLVEAARVSGVPLDYRGAAVGAG
jgi:sugar phosphate isomerase/epimerase